MNTQSGRSMVEMLGVLAIIGVLSIGAIAGYSKAMFKYKLNKQTIQIGYILDYIIANQDQLRKLPYYMKNTLNKLGVVPNEMIHMYMYRKKMLTTLFQVQTLITEIKLST